MRSLALSALLLISITVFSQYNNPYRLTYDGSSYFVSNKTGGYITKIDSAFNTSTVISGLYSPNDIFSGTVAGNSAIIIIDSNQLKLYDQSTYSSFINLTITGAVEAHDGVFNPNNSNEFFISDRAGNKIIKGSIGAPPFYPVTYTVLVSGISKPAGMIFDAQNRLLVLTETIDSEVHWINISNGYDSLLTSTNLDNLNDISQDNEGNFYVTCWGDNYLYRLDSTLNNPYRLIAFNNPSGMFVNTTYDYLAMCCYNCNKVEFKNFHLFSPLDDVTTCINDSFFTSFNPIYQGIGTYNSDNQFVLEVSDSNGNFSAPTIVGIITSDTIPPYFTTVLPEGTYASSGHKYRFRSTSPSILSYFTKDLNLKQLPDAFINESDTLDICTGSSILLGQTAEIDHIYTWSPASLVNDPTSSQVTFDTAKIASYNLSLYEIDTVSGCSNTSEIQINVGPNLSISQLADSLEICPGDSIKVGVDGLPYFFSWSGSDSLDNPGTGNPNFFDIDSRLLKVVFSDFTLTCSGSDSVYVTVNTPASLPYSGSIADSSCDGNTLVLDLSLDTNYTYQWSSTSASQVNSNEYQPEFQFSSTGLHSIIAEYQNKITNCEAKDSILLKVNENPQVFGQTEYTEVVCRSNARSLQFELDTNNTYNWQSSHGMVSNSTSYKPEFTVNLPVAFDTLEVTAISKNNQCTSTENMYLEVLDFPSDLSLVNVSDYIRIDDNTLMQELNATGARLVVDWYVNGNLKTVIADSIGFFPRDSFSHGDSVMAELRWIIDNDTLCTFNSNHYLKTNLGGIDDLKFGIAVYPNPSNSGQSFIEIHANGNIEQLVMFAIDGREMTTAFKANKLYYNCTPGSYILKIKINNNWYFRKIILN